MRRLARFLALPLALAVAACASQSPAAPTVAPGLSPLAASATPPQATPAPAAAPPPTSTAAPAPATATAAPPPLFSATPTAQLPAELITADTAGRLAELRSVGLGAPIGAALTPDGSTLVVGTGAGLAWLRLPDLAPFSFARVGFASEPALSPDGAYLAHTTVGADYVSRTALRRAADVSLAAELEGSAPRFSPDSATLATSSGIYAEAPRSWLWRAADGAPLAELAGAEPLFSPDGRYVATVEVKYETPSLTRVYGADGAGPLLELAATTPAFSPDGQLLAVSRGGQVEVYALPGGELRAAVLTQVEPAAAFSADGRELLIVAGDELIAWDLVADRELRRTQGVNLAGEVFSPYGPQFAPGGAAVASLVPPLGDCPPAGVRISSTADGSVSYEDTTSYAVAFAPDGSRAATVYNSGVRAVELASGAVTELALPGYQAVAFSPDGATMALATVAGDERNRLVGRVELWDVAAGELRSVLEAKADDFVFTSSRLRFSPDGSRLSGLANYGCAAIGFNKVITWDVASGAIIGEIDQIETPLDAGGLPVEAAVAFAPDGTAAFWSGGAAGFVVGRPAQEPQRIGTGSEPTALDVSADGLSVAMGEASGLVTLFAARGSEGRPLGSLGAPVRAVAFSADGARLVALAGAEAVVWELDGGLETARLSVGAGADRPLLSADGALLAVRAAGGVALYELASGRRVGLAAGAAEDVALGPGQRLLATVRDGGVILWGTR